ncbi:adenosylhomocysteinase [bacterium]|nr:adenosylhomocysteinase [bacterium]MBU1782113.1 adenosylhomocysteinase [bacterium]
MSTQQYDVADINLASKGRQRIKWAAREMSVLSIIKERFKKEKPLAGVKIAACLHVTSETANLVDTLKEGGAEVVLCASNPLSTQDDVAASIVLDLGIPVFAIKGESNETYYRHIYSTLEIKPDITMDDGADLVSIIHKEMPDLAKKMMGGTEETTTGVIRLKSLEARDALMFPVIAVNEAMTKHLFDNRYGTGQSTIDGILRATNVLLSGKNFVVCGYGWCGKGVAMRAKGAGAKVIVTEVNPVKALEALMEGFQVMPIMEASKIGDIFVTVTGDINVIRREHFEVMKDKAILANSGHFNVEIDIPTLESISKSRRTVREFVEEFTLKDEKKIYLLAEGRLVNLSSAEGHPSSVMDMSFANQALSAQYMKENKGKLKNKVYVIPQEIDEDIAFIKLSSMGMSIDELTEEQKKYLASWELGT